MCFSIEMSISSISVDDVVLGQKLDIGILYTFRNKREKTLYPGAYGEYISIFKIDWSNFHRRGSESFIEFGLNSFHP